MLTLFSTAKPFHGLFNIIQRNALRSWTELRPSCDVILFGDDEGSEQVAAELGLRHVPTIARNESGVPLISSLFQQAQSLATTPLLCYSNCDIIFMSDFLRVLGRVASLHDRFLMIGQRYKTEVNELLDFRPGWEEQLRRQVERNGVDLSFGLDYFAFPKGLWVEIPAALAVGRAGWDNWPAYQARLHKAVVVDATPVVMAVHQDHDYSHHPQGKLGVYGGLEVDHNYQTLGGARNAFSVLDATHIMAQEGLRIRCRSCYPMCVCKLASF